MELSHHPRRIARRLLGAIVVLLVLFLIPVIADLRRGDGQSRESMIPTATAVVPPTTQMIETLTADLNQFWRGQFALVGAEEQYVPPVFTLYDPALVVDVMACDQMLREEPPALYCSVPQVLYLNQAYLVSIEGQPWSQTYIGIILAHEWAHHIRYLIDPSAPSANKQNSVPLELQAYCAAGLWVKDEIDSGLIDPVWLDGYRQRLSEVEGAEATHGSGDEQLDALDQGLNSQNPADCGYGELFAAPVAQSNSIGFIQMVFRSYHQKGLAQERTSPLPIRYQDRH